MIEPPGFTGVLWQARPAEQLARDLNAGAGTTQLAEAVAAWTRLGTQFGTALLDYDRILTTLRQAWRSDNGTAFLDHITALRTALEKAASAAAHNATRTADHIVTYEVARVAMPHPVELAALAETQRLLTQVSSTLGAPLLATGDDTDTQQDIAKTHAARVMRTYEAASETLAEPWQQEHPPVVAPDTALRAEHTATRTAATPETAPPLTTGFPRLPTISIPRELTAFRSTPVTQSTSAAQYSPAATSAAHSDVGGRMIPGAMTPASTTTGDSERDSRSAEVYSRTDHSDVVGQLQAAPAVLGVGDDIPAADAGTTDDSSAGAAR